MPWQAKERQRLMATTRSQEARTASPLQVSEGALQDPADTLTRTARISFCCFKRPSLQYLLRQLQETSTVFKDKCCTPQEHWQLYLWGTTLPPCRFGSLHNCHGNYLLRTLRFGSTQLFLLWDLYLFLGCYYLGWLEVDEHPPSLLGGTCFAHIGKSALMLSSPQILSQPHSLSFHPPTRTLLHSLYFLKNHRLSLQCKSLPLLSDILECILPLMILCLPLEDRIAQFIKYMHVGLEF